MKNQYKQYIFLFMSTILLNLMFSFGLDLIHAGNNKGNDYPVCNIGVILNNECVPTAECKEGMHVFADEDIPICGEGTTCPSGLRPREKGEKVPFGLGLFEFREDVVLCIK